MRLTIVSWCLFVFICIDGFDSTTAQRSKSSSDKAAPSIARKNDRNNVSPSSNGNSPGKMTLTERNRRRNQGLDYALGRNPSSGSLKEKSEPLPDNSKKSDFLTEGDDEARRLGSFSQAEFANGLRKSNFEEDTSDDTGVKRPHEDSSTSSGGSKKNNRSKKDASATSPLQRKNAIKRPNNQKKEIGWNSDVVTDPLKKGTVDGPSTKDSDGKKPVSVTKSDSKLRSTTDKKGRRTNDKTLDKDKDESSTGNVDKKEGRKDETSDKNKKTANILKNASSKTKSSVERMNFEEPPEIDLGLDNIEQLNANIPNVESFNFEVTVNLTGIQMQATIALASRVIEAAKSLIEKWELEFVSFSAEERTVIKDNVARIDLEKAGFLKNGKTWALIQLKQNSRPDKAIATVVLETDSKYPVQLIRNAFVHSMEVTAPVWLSLV